MRFKYEKGQLVSFVYLSYNKVILLAPDFLHGRGAGVGRIVDGKVYFNNLIAYTVELTKDLPRSEYTTNQSHREGDWIMITEQEIIEVLMEPSREENMFERNLTIDL